MQVFSAALLEQDKWCVYVSSYIFATYTDTNIKL